VWNNRFVVGPSWGTLVALATQSGRPNTAGLVLLSGYYFPTFRIDALMIAPGALPVLGDILRHTRAGCAPTTASYRCR